jgi:3-phenylpropionate/trans-cinnamate dioxygenase ferredoxin subunit
MSEFVEVAKLSEFNPGTLKMVRIGEHEYLLARLQDKYYAYDNRCPHLGGNLSAGKLQGTILTCPRHHSQFDLTDGHNVRWTDWTGLQLWATKLLKSPRPLHPYEVKIENGKILIKGADII